MRAAIAIAILFAMPVAAEVYKWVDEDGVTHFGERPRQGAEQIDVGPTNSSAPPAEISARMERARKARERERKRQASVSGPGPLCDMYRDRLQSLEETWEEVKRQGYSVADENSYKRKKARRLQKIEEEC